MGGQILQQSQQLVFPPKEEENELACAELEASDDGSMSMSEEMDTVGTDMLTTEGFTAAKDANANPLLSPQEGVSEYTLGSLTVRVVAAKDTRKPLKRVASTSSRLGGILFGGGGAEAEEEWRLNRYARITFGGQIHVTSPVYDTANPVFPREEQSFFDVSLPVPELANPKDAKKQMDDSASAVSSLSQMPQPQKPVLRVAILQSQDQRRRLLRRKLSEPARASAAAAAAASSAPRKLDRSQSSDLLATEQVEDLLLGTSSLDVTPLLTGAVTYIDQWLHLSDAKSSSSTYSSSNTSATGRVRIVCQYEPTDPPPRRGDIVRFTGFVNSLDIYPVPPHQTFRVLGNAHDLNSGRRIGDARTILSTTPEAREDQDQDHHSHDGDDDDDNMVYISYTSPENWILTFRVHRYSLICAIRHRTAVECYQDEIIRLANKLAHSPAAEAVSTTARRLPKDGIFTVGIETAMKGAGLLGRWYRGGVKMIVGDIIYATNIDGNHTIYLHHRHGADADADADDDDDGISYQRSFVLPPDIDKDDDLSLASAPSNDSDDDGTITTAATPHSQTYHNTRSTHNTNAALNGMPPCPISGRPMVHPVVAADGHTYEKASIARWMLNNNTSPTTGTPMEHDVLVPNYLLLSTFQERKTDRRASGASTGWRK